MSEQFISIPLSGQDEWKEIPGYPGYAICSNGSVWSCRRRKMVWTRLKPFSCKGGYRLVRLADGDSRAKDFFVHLLVLTAFKGPCPADMECCHEDGNPANNRLDNLRWDTHSANCKEKQRHGRPNGGKCFVTGHDPRRGATRKGEETGSARLTTDQVLSICREYRCPSRRKSNVKQLAAKYGVSETSIRDILVGRTWKHLNAAKIALALNLI